MNLPDGLRAAIENLAARHSLSSLAETAENLSARYRRGERAKSETWQAAYAAVRLPATYAAVAAALGRLTEACPEVEPATMLDLGTGPGTAVWAAREAFPGLARAEAFDRDAGMVDLAGELAEAGGLACDVTWRRADASAEDSLPAGDLVVAAYVLNELPAASRERLVDRAWEACRGWMLIVEPGTPDAFRALMRTRARLVELDAHIAAPCPHGEKCPMLAGTSWCHFSQRLARSRTHRLAKRASLGFEDEKYCYLAVGRSALPLPRPPRIVAQPRIGKGDAKLDLCTDAGLTVRVVQKREDGWKSAKKAEWGDACEE